MNGSSVTPSIAKGYVAITRKWSAGDTIVLKFPMSIQRIKAIDRIEATKGQVALRRGPLIYCVEAVDQQLDKVFNPTAALMAEWKNDQLDGVMVIKSTWADGSPFTAIPYYSRCNREGSTHSTVWVKDE